MSLVRLGTLGVLMTGVAWTVLGLVDMATLGGRGSEVLNSAFMEATLYLAALVSTPGGVVGLHARQTSNYGRLGTAGFLAIFTGTAILLVALVLSFLVGDLFGAAFLDPALGAGLEPRRRLREHRSYRQNPGRSPTLTAGCTLRGRTQMSGYP
jgi:hypothetical protein